MSTTQASSEGVKDATRRASVPLRLEVAIIPVTDVDRARDFYTALGWRFDGELKPSDGYHLVQMTPPGSDASIIFGRGVTSATPGSAGGLVLAVEDLAAAREELIARGADVGEPFHDAGGGVIGGFHATSDERAPGRDPQNRSYATYASFRDPDGNEWILQEVTQRAPGRIETTDVAALAELLHETAQHHDAFEKASDPHDWWDWYAAYAQARQRGADPHAAEAAADRYMADVKGIASTRG